MQHNCKSISSIVNKFIVSRYRKFIRCSTNPAKSQKAFGSS
jgi:hypothetical protein